MASDFGVAIAPNYRDSPLARVSPLAVKVWLYLASRVAHFPTTTEIARQSISVQPGEVVLSSRILMQEFQCGPTQITKALRELETIDAIEKTPVRKTSRVFSKREQGCSQIENAVCSRSGNGSYLLATRFKLNGLRTLARKDSVTDSGTKSIKRNTRETALESSRRERERMMEQMQAEGREVEGV